MTTKRQTKPAAAKVVADPREQRHPTTTVRSARAVCIVALKMPHGLILHLDDLVPEGEPQRDGTVRQVMRARKRASAGEVVLKGYLERYNPSNPPQAQGSAFAFTENVPADFMEEWLAQNKDSDIVRNGLIIVGARRDNVEAETREFAASLCGLEPVDPSRLPKGLATYNKDT